MSSFDAAWLAAYRDRMAAYGKAPPFQQILPMTAVTIKRPRATPEHDFHVTAIDYLRLVLPIGCILTSIDHANARNALAGALRKARGVQPGIPDIYIAINSVTVWFECKAAKGKISQAQQDFRDTALKQGHHWFAIRTIADVEAALEQVPFQRPRDKSGSSVRDTDSSSAHVTCGYQE